MRHSTTTRRRTLGLMMIGLGAGTLMRAPSAMAAAPDGAGAVTDMAAALQSATALSFKANSSFGASVASEKLKTLGSQASVVFQRPDSLFAVFGAGGEPDVQMLISGGEATLFRLSLASKATVKLAPENGAAFAVPGLFIPFLGLLADDPETGFFGGINSVTPIAQAAPDQPQETTLAAVMGGSFTGEVWVDKGTSLPTRTTGTWFGANTGVAASAAVNYIGWSSAAPAEGAFAVKGLAEAKSVELDALGL